LATFTISSEDIFDYLRCPKILAIKSFRLLHPPLHVAHPRKEPEVPASVVGRIGETAVMTAFSPSTKMIEGAAKLQQLIVQ